MMTAQNDSISNWRVTYDLGVGLAELDFENQGFSTAFASTFRVGAEYKFKKYYLTAAALIMDTRGQVDLNLVEYRANLRNVGLDLRAGLNYYIGEKISIIGDLGFAYIYQFSNEFESKRAPDIEDLNRGFNGLLSTSLGFQHDLKYNNSIFLKIQSFTGVFDVGYVDHAAVKYDNVTTLSFGVSF
jgi:hypothetical protein